MTKNKLIDMLFLIIVSAQTILMSVLFIVQILRIYYDNNAIFTREICKEYILQILPVIIIWIVIIIVSFIYSHIKKNPDKNIAKITNIVKLNNLERVCPKFDGELEEAYSLLKKENKKRKIALYINIVISILCSIMGLCYLLNVKHFKSDGDLAFQAVQMFIHLFPWVIITFISMIGYVLYEEYSAKKSIESIKFIIKNKGKKNNNLKYDKRKNLIMKIARLSITIIAVALIIHGVFNGGANDVLQKAINICTECIGLG